MSDKKGTKSQSKSNASSQIPKNAGEMGLVSMKFKKAVENRVNEDGSVSVSGGSDVAGMIIGLVVIALQIYILWYTFRLERIGCKCARDFRLTYAQVYIILSMAVSVALGIMYALTDENNMVAMAIAAATLQGIMFVAGVVYIVFVWQYISKLRRIKCACSEDLARDVWEVVNYIQIAVLVLAVLLIIIGMLFSTNLYYKLAPVNKK